MIDLDEDGIPDDSDPCISSPEDDSGDWDRDGIANAGDGCALNGTGSGTGNVDNDGMPDACDPFTSIPFDRPRCMMAFTRTDLAARLWLPRTGEIGWTVNPGNLRSIPDASQTGTVIAAESLEGTNTTTYQVQFSF